jgi:hypothetical protein
MNPTPTNDLPPRCGFLRRLFSWRWLRRALIGLVGLATLIGLLVTEENWRGKHDWETYRHEQEAKGERFDWQAFAPPTVPDDQNFLAAPAFTNLINEPLSPFPKSSKQFPYDFGNWKKALLTDLRSWQTAYRQLREDDNGEAFPLAPQPDTPAADVLFALNKFRLQVEALRQASLRPQAFIPIHYEDGFNAVAQSMLPNLAATKKCAQLLDIRAIAELADGQSSNALNDLELLLRVNDALRNPPLLISELVRMAIVGIGIQPIWEGLAQHQWSDPQLAALDTALAKEDFLADYELGMRGERNCAILTYENIRRTGEMIVSGDDLHIMTIKMRWMPNAFYYQNELAFAHLYQAWLFPMVDTQSRIISPAVQRQVDAEVRAAQKHYSPYTIEARMTVPALDAAVKRFAFAQASIDLARVGCALERYCLAHGQYPDSLATLAPQFITQVPHDIINGQPLHYRLKPNGQFVLYSVGWNETDDRGTVVIDPKHGTVRRDEGDWVWQYPEP